MVERIMEWVCSPLGLIIISFLLGNCLRKLPPIWKGVAYLIIMGIEHTWMPEGLRKMIKRTVNATLTARQKKLLDDFLGNKGYLHKSANK